VRVTAAAAQAPLKCTRTWLLPRDADADAVAAGHAAISALAILAASEAMAMARGWTGRLPFVGERIIPFQNLQAVLTALCGEAQAARFKDGSGRLCLQLLNLEGMPLGEVSPYAAVAAIFCDVSWEGLVWHDGDADQADIPLPTLACGDTMLVARLGLGEMSVSDDALQGNARLTAAVPPSGTVAPVAAAPVQTETRPASANRRRPLSAASAGDDTLAVVSAGVLALQAACGGRSLNLREPITRAVCRLDTAEDLSAVIASVAVDGEFAEREAREMELQPRSDVCFCRDAALFPSLLLAVGEDHVAIVLRLAWGYGAQGPAAHEIQMLHNGRSRPSSLPPAQSRRLHCKRRAAAVFVAPDTRCCCSNHLGTDQLILLTTPHSTLHRWAREHPAFTATTASAVGLTLVGDSLQRPARLKGLLALCDASTAYGRLHAPLLEVGCSSAGSGLVALISLYVSSRCYCPLFRLRRANLPIKMTPPLLPSPPPFPPPTTTHTQHNTGRGSGRVHGVGRWWARLARRKDSSTHASGRNSLESPWHDISTGICRRVAAG
jgi:hypothetical protein